MEAGSLPSEDEEESGDHTHPDNRGLGEEGSETAHGNAPGDCSLVAEESGGRSHPWQQDRGDEEGIETGMGLGRGVPQSSESAIW